MNIEADQLKHDELQQTSVFTGRVVVTKGSIVLRGARLEVRQDAEGYQSAVVTGGGTGIGRAVGELRAQSGYRVCAIGLDRDDDVTMFEQKVRLPDEFAGHAMVFRTFDKVSYALVMSSVKPTRVGYELKHPDAPY